MRRLITGLTLSFLAQTLAAQIGRPAASATYLGLTAYSHQATDAFSAGTNPAALSAQTKFTAGLYGERRYLLKALSDYTLAAAKPAGNGVFGAGATYRGDALYNESSLQLSYGRQLGAKVAVGLRFDYVAIKAATYGSAATIVPAVGVLYHLTDALNAGLSVYNPAGQTLGKAGLEKLPQVFKVGLGYDVSSSLYIGTEIEKAEGRPVAINAGLHYLVAEKFIGRAGISSAASVFYFGFGVPLKNLRVDVTASLHPSLGFTPGLLLLYTGKK